ncbi:hypothetical protein [Halosimplex sp. J119]
MPIDPEIAAIAVVSAVGAAGVAVVTLRHYEPPPPPDGDAEAPEPVMEAGIFFVLATVLFTVFGFALVFVAESGGIVGRAATLLPTPIGFYVAYSIREGEMGSHVDEATAQLGFVSAVALGAFPVVLLAASAV